MGKQADNSEEVFDWATWRVCTGRVGHDANCWVHTVGVMGSWLGATIHHQAAPCTLTTHKTSNYINYQISLTLTSLYFCQWPSTTYDLQICIKESFDTLEMAWISYLSPLICDELLNNNCLNIYNISEWHVCYKVIWQWRSVV